VKAAKRTSLDVINLRLALQEPRRLTDVSPWQGHIPFGLVAVDLVAPRRIVELGTAKGDSYCAFCQAVDTLGLETACAAVDTWTGDAHAGELENDVLDELRLHHDPLYGRFSELIRSTFDDALCLFADRSIDLLHIDGYHTYDAVRHDFETWLPKLSDRAVVLLHDTAVREGDFGVWRLWEELESRYPSFAFTHSFGLGVIIVGANPNGDLVEFVEGAGNDGGTTAAIFAALGERLVARTRERELRATAARVRETAAASDSARARAAEQLEVEKRARVDAEQELLRAQAKAAQQLEVEKRARLDAEQALLRAQARAAEQLEVEKRARLDAEQHLRALLATRTFRYTQSLRTAYARLAHGRAASVEPLEPSDGNAFMGARAEPGLNGGHPSPEFVPPGHFYSAIPDIEDIATRRKEIFDRDPSFIPSVHLRVEEQLRLLDDLVPLLSDVPFADTPSPSLRYHYANGMFDRSDGLFLHLLLRHLRPSRVVEIGSGFSSACTLDTVERFTPATQCTFIDPNPSVLRSVLRTEDEESADIVELLVQHAPLELYSQLGANDMLFIDSTHVVKIGSDVNHLFFDILPTLEPGVVVHIHDVFPLFEYPWTWVQERRVWSESYLLRAFLQFNDEFEIILWPPFLARVQPSAYGRFHTPIGDTGGSLYMRRRLAIR
jgi:predicted O-methyltransferase YrrM